MRNVRLFRNSNRTAFFWFGGIFVFFMSRQVPFNNLSVIMNLALMGLFMISFVSIFRNIRHALQVQQLMLPILTGMIFANLIYSQMLGNEVGNAVRFAIILLLLIYSFYIGPPEKFIKIFITIILIQAIAIICFSIYLSLFFDLASYGPIRVLFNEREWGDVYTFNGSFFIVQVKGNALIPFALFVMHFYRMRRTLLIKLMLLVACVVAGNFAFVIAISVFYIGYFLKSVNSSILLNKLFVLLVASVLLGVPVYQYYIKVVLEQKRDGSLNTRNDQASLLMNDMSENPATFLFGQGLGNTIEKVTASRDYRGDVYFELQTLYLLNQIGVIFFILLVIYVFIIPYLLWNKWIFFIYICYVLYAVTNPYIFDSNQIAVILILNALNKYIGLDQSLLKKTDLKHQ